jgi:16S rRNA A1518/A1519 N6-dimethyltransferase RsmA/KsgA/DIM1 with predicted DNA glycosylase/AP lyase activity
MQPTKNGGDGSEGSSPEDCGSKDGKESILSISVKAYGNPKYVMTVKSKYFSPEPNVDSAIILIDDISKKFF